MLHARFPEKRLVVRNFARPADEVGVQQRPSDYTKLDDPLAAFGADTLILFFGFNESFAGPGSVVARRAARARIKRILMRGEKEHGWILVENFLRPVAVVDIPVDNGCPLEAVRLLKVASADGGVVEQAETHRPVAFGMVPGRAGRTEDRVRIIRITASAAAVPAPVQGLVSGGHREDSLASP